MKQPLNRKQKFSSSEKTTILILAILLVVGVILLVALGVYLLSGNLPQFAAMTTQTPTTPTMFIPTPDCGSPTFILGSTTFQIQNISPAPDGTLAVPPDGSGIAYWMEGTNNNYVFVLSPTPDNISLLSTLSAGSIAKATWTNCNSTTYNLFAPEPGPASVLTLLDQSVSGITVFLQSDPATASFVVKGELTEEQISTINTPVSGGSEIQAEIGLLEITTSPDGSTIRIGVSIYNWGQSAFTLSASDVSLTQPDGAPLVMLNSEPALPKEIGAGSTETIYFTFPHPSFPTATMKIFEIEYDIKGY